MLSSEIGRRFRHPEPPEAIEFRAFTHGLQPDTVPAMMQHFVDDWRRLGVDAWNEVPNHWRPACNDRVGWWTLPTYLADEFVAPLLGAPRGTCILQPNVHWTIQCLLSTPELIERGSEIVVTDAAFPSVLHSVQQWNDLIDLTPRIVSTTPDGTVDEAAVLEAIGPETAMVALSHVGFTTGARLTDAFLQDVAQAVHAHGGWFLIDGYHSASTMPIDVTALNCDLYVGGLLKEACGSSGNAFAYLRDGLPVTPRLTGWFGDADPFGFQKAPEAHPDIRQRFLGGTTAVASMYHAVEGLRILLDVGLEAVRAHSLALTDHAIERATAAGLSLRSPREHARRSAMVLLEVPDAEALCLALKERHIYTDSRKTEVLRMAPFVWNTLDEVDRAFDVIEALLVDDAYRSVSSGATPGPVT